MPLRTLLAAILTAALCSAWQQKVAPDLPILPLGRGDVITVTIEGEPDLSGRVKISEKGAIIMPLLAEPMHVDGLLPLDIQILIAEAYQREKLLLRPIVKVAPAEYHSYLVKVTGEVTHPYEFQALDQPTLLSVLATAGGPTPNSDGKIEILRRDPATHEQTVRIIPVQSLLENNDPKYNITLKGGEEIHLPAIPW